MIKLVKNANEIVRTEMKSAPVKAFYLSVVERYEKKYTQLFPVDLQNLITKLGIVINDASVTKRNINYCATSIDFLCNVVLDNPSLYNTFDSLEINKYGNNGKHTIKFTTADMDKCVLAYNKIISQLIIKYGLYSLNLYYIPFSKGSYQKNFNSRTVLPINSAPLNCSMNKANSNNYHNTNKNTNTVNKSSNSYNTNNDLKSKPISKTVVKSNNISKTKSTSNANTSLKKTNSTCLNNVNNFGMTATIKEGDGRYMKGMFSKKKMLNFKLDVKFTNPKSYNIKSVIATVKCKNNKIDIKLPNESKVSEIDLPTSQYTGRIDVSIVTTYKIGLLKTKEIKCSVAKVL